MQFARASTFAALWLAAGCNAIFGLEEPVVDAPEASGGQGGEPPSGDSGGQRPQGGGSAGDGGSSSEPLGGDGGAVHAPRGGSESEGGSAGALEPGPPSAGAPSDAGNAGQPSGGAAGAGGTHLGESGAPGAGGSAGASACADGESRCLDARTLETCASGSPRRETCSLGCFADACAECVPGTVECRAADNSVRACDDDGRLGSFEECVGKTCVLGEGCLGECEPGAVRCNTMNGDAEACDRGEWSRLEECETTEELCVVESGEAMCIPNPVIALGPDQPLTNGSLYNHTPSVIWIFPLPTPTDAAHALQLGLIGSGEPAYARLALYADDGADYPGALLGITDALTVTAPEAEARDLLPSTLLLEAGAKYWIAVVFANVSSPRLYCRNHPPAKSYLLSRSFDSGFPETFPSGAQASFDTECNLFVRVRKQTP